MKASFNNFQLYADRELYEAMIKKYGSKPYDNKTAIKTNNSFASWMVAEKIGDKYKITPITSQSNERLSLQMEAYWTTLKEFPIKEYADVPLFYKQWFVNRGLIKEAKDIKRENKSMKITKSKLREIILEEYEKIKEEVDDWLENDLKITVGWALPGADNENYEKRFKKWVKLYKRLPNSDDFLLVMKDGEKIQAVKYDEWRSHWGFKTKKGYLKGRDQIEKYFDEKYLSGLKKLEKDLKDFDWHYEYSDDPRAYRSGETKEKEIKDLIDDLNKKGFKKQTMQLWKKYAPKEFKYPK